MTSAVIDLAGLNALRQQVVEAREKMREQAKTLIKEGSAAIFAEYGDILQSFGWTQYTPYFNDGDGCTFSVNELNLVAKEDLEEGEDGTEREWAWESSRAFSRYSDGSKLTRKQTTWSEGNVGDPRYDACWDACIAIYSIFEVDESIAKDVLGGHVRVIFTAEGVEVEEWEHE